MTKCDYLVDAATQIRLALERDVSEDYEAAFNHYQNGVDVLLRGMHGEGGRASSGLVPSSSICAGCAGLCWLCRTSVKDSNNS